MSERIRCLVPHCRRTFKSDGGDDEVICGKHWRAIPLAIRKAKTDAHRIYRRRFGSNPFWSYPAGSPERIACVEAGQACADTWKAAKEAAIERAAGI